MLEPVFIKKYSIGKEEFEVMLQIIKNGKFDGGMMPLHVYTVRNLAENETRDFTKQEIGFSGRYDLLPTESNEVIKWDRRLFEKIKNEILPEKYFVKPDSYRKFF